jgi:hypothetical protein
MTKNHPTKPQKAQAKRTRNQTPKLRPPTSDPKPIAPSGAKSDPNATIYNAKKREQNA